MSRRTPSGRCLSEEISDWRIVRLTPDAERNAQIGVEVLMH